MNCCKEMVKEIRLNAKVYGNTTTSSREIKNALPSPLLPYEKLWNATIEKVTVYDNGNLTFHFKNGAEITKSLNP